MSRQHFPGLRLSAVSVLGTKFDPGSIKKLPSVKADIAVMADIYDTASALMRFSTEGPSGASWRVDSTSSRATLRTIFILGTNHLPPSGERPAMVKVSVQIHGDADDLEEAMRFLMREGIEGGGDWTIEVYKDFFDKVTKDTDAKVTIGHTNSVGEYQEVETTTGGLRRAARNATRMARNQRPHSEPTNAAVYSTPNPDEIEVRDGLAYDTRTGIRVADMQYVPDEPQISGAVVAAEVGEEPVERGTAQDASANG